jgi:zinc protease
LDVLTDVVAHPIFPADSFARILQSSEVGLEQQEQSPAAVASKIFYKAIYPGHPYGQPPSGTRESLKKNTPRRSGGFPPALLRGA